MSAGPTTSIAAGKQGVATTATKRPNATDMLAVRPSRQGRPSATVGALLSLKGAR